MNSIKIIIIVITLLFIIDVYIYMTITFPDFKNYPIKDLDPYPDINKWNSKDLLSLTLAAINVTYDLCYKTKHKMCSKYPKPVLPSNYILIKEFYSEDCNIDNTLPGFIGCSPGAYLLRQGENLILLFRGARTILDWNRVFNTRKSNITFIDYETCIACAATGPLEKYKKMRDTIWDYILNQSDYKNIYVWGYSLGSTQGTLFTIDSINKKKSGILDKNINVITYILGTFKISNKNSINILNEGNKYNSILYRIETWNEFTRYYPPRYWFNGPCDIVRYYPAPNNITIPMSHYGLLVGHHLVSYVQSLINMNYK